MPLFFTGTPSIYLLFRHMNLGSHPNQLIGYKCSWGRSLQRILILRNKIKSCSNRTDMASESWKSKSINFHGIFTIEAPSSFLMLIRYKYIMYTLTEIFRASGQVNSNKILWQRYKIVYQSCSDHIKKLSIILSNRSFHLTWILCKNSRKVLSRSHLRGNS